MARPHLVGNHVEYAVPLAVRRAAPRGCVYIHFAWFHRRQGHWLAEWAGYVPEPDVPPDLVGDARLAAMNGWRRRVQDRVSEYQCLDQAVDLAAWNACEVGGAICVDVTRYQWPVGDHVWHHWSPVIEDIVWGDEHTFIEVNRSAQEVVGNQRSHRPIRDAVPGQHVIDITHTPWAEYYGHIFGRFVRRAAEGRWGFEPSNEVFLPSPMRAALAEASVDTMKVGSRWGNKERITVRRAAADEPESGRLKES